jgi:hypothetical protein
MNGRESRLLELEARSREDEARVQAAREDVIAKHQALLEKK